MEELWGDQETADPDWRKTLVVSGGVASNQAIKGYVKKVCDYYDCDLVLPPPRYVACTYSNEVLKNDFASPLDLSNFIWIIAPQVVHW